MQTTNRYNHRDLSWLGFNYRVLQESMDPTVPLIERVRFLAIYSSNLDEYFRVRVAGLRSMIRVGKKTKRQMGFDPKDVLKAIQAEVNRQQVIFTKVYTDQIIPNLAEEGIKILNMGSLTDVHRAFVDQYFENHLMPFVQPMLLEAKKVRPFLNNAALYLLICLRDPDMGQKRFGIVKIPSEQLPRFIEMPSESKVHELLLLDDVVRLIIPKLFPGFEVLESYSIKLTRDAELYIEDEFSGDLVAKIKKSLRKRNVGPASRLVYDRSMPKEVLAYLAEIFGLGKLDLLPEGRYHNNFDFFKFPSFGKNYLLNKALPPLAFPALETCADIFEAIAQRDYLIHPPFHRYQSVIRFFDAAADDPDVSHIKVVQYRVAKRSKIISSLIRAVKNGKSVSVFVEIKARFDEEANLKWGETLQKAGVQVHYSFPGLKVHSKTALVIRKEKKGTKKYCYLGTGNFHEGTAKVYTDFGLFTARKSLVDETSRVFEFLETGRIPEKKFKHLLVGQFNIRPKLQSLIEAEIKAAQLGQHAEIFLKLNSIQDKQKIDLLYRASQSGVKIRMIVRGICCLVPGVAEMSEHIQAISIVDRFLEHSRVFVFYNHGKKLVFLSSADWMERNLSRRVEVAFPIYDPQLHQQILDVMEMQWRDNVKARYLDAKRYNQYRKNDLPPYRSQYEIYDYFKTKI